MRILTVFGTRPEAIKLALLAHRLNARSDVRHALCVTGQHRQMLDQVLNVFALKPDYDLALMRDNQSLASLSALALTRVSETIAAYKPDWVVVQGDTTSAFIAALAAFYHKVRVAHVEAGLRTGNIYSPWPEEANRKLISQIASVHFPPTETSADNLRREGVCAEDILTTGNTVIDALHWVRAKLENDTDLRAQLDQQFAFLPSNKRLILVTGHRRENMDGGLARTCAALAKLAARGDVAIVYPVHLNPQVQATAYEILGAHPDIHLIAPLDYVPFVYLMCRAHLIITDSGGIQEEAPGLGKPVLVTRDTTERPEALAAGTARLVGTDGAQLFHAATQLLNDERAYAAMAQAANPFGDGQASLRIAQRLLQ